MSALQQLPEDLRTVITLLVERGMSYSAAATALGVGESAVRERAQVALVMLAPAQARELGGEEREQIGDYMLGQQQDSEQAATRQAIESSAPASAWAHALSKALAGEPIPEGSQTPQTREAGRSAAQRPPATRPARAPRRNLFALMLVSAVAIVAIVLAVVLGKGSSTQSAQRTQPKIVGHAIMASPSGARSAGLFEVLKGGSKLAYYVAAVGLQPTNGFYYALWLADGPGGHARALNRAPNVGSNGRIVGGALLPANATSYHEVLLTRETASATIPSTPGETVLKGRIQYAR